MKRNHNDAPDHVAAAVTERRKALLLTLRDVEAKSKILLDENPELYDIVSFSFVHQLEKQGRKFFDVTRDAKKLRTYIQIIYRGDLDLWVKETGIILNVPVITDYGLNGPEDDWNMPLYREGQSVSGQQVANGEEALRSLSMSVSRPHWYLEVTGHLMEPTVWPGQTVAVQPRTAIAPGELVVLNRGSQGLHLAWKLDARRYAYNRKGDNGRKDFELTAADEVLGVVAWVKPQIPELTA